MFALRSLARQTVAAPVLVAERPFSKCGTAAPPLAPVRARRSLHDARDNARRFLSKAATKRLPLTSKRARKGYYKGNGSASTGRLNSRGAFAAPGSRGRPPRGTTSYGARAGRFIVDPAKVLRLVRPPRVHFSLRRGRGTFLSSARRSCRTSRASS